MDEDEWWLDCDRLTNYETLKEMSQTVKSISACYISVKHMFFESIFFWSKLELIEFDNDICRECQMFHNSELLPKQSFNSLNFPRLIRHQSLSDICRIETSLELKELMLVNQAKYKSVITFYLCLSSLRKFDKKPYQTNL